MRRIDFATRSSAASQPIGSNPRPSVRTSGVISRSGCSFCMYRFTPLGQSLPSLKGNSSQGSKPTTLLSLTLSFTPHCWPQKQQCVLTTRSGSPMGAQPKGGTSCGWGPYWATIDGMAMGSLAISALRIPGLAAPRRLPEPVLQEREVLAAAGRAHVLVVLVAPEAIANAELGLDRLEIMDVE